MTKKIPKKIVRPGIDEYGRSGLHDAVINNELGKAERLIKNGIDINHPDDNGWTPLHFAAQGYSEKMIKLLINAGADVDVKDNFGNTPLFRAIFNSNGKGLSTLVLFINAGAKLNNKNISGVSVLDLVNTVNDDSLKDFFRKIQERNIT